MYKPYEVAISLLKHAKNKDIVITNLKLQKLVYIAHGLYLSSHNNPLINESVEVWQYGPVIPSLYHDFKEFSDGPITEFDDSVNILDVSSENIVKETIRIFGRLNSLNLVSRTHAKGSPWSKASKRSLSVIPNREIKAHYISKVLKGKFDYL